MSSRPRTSTIWLAALFSIAALATIVEGQQRGGWPGADDPGWADEDEGGSSEQFALPLPRDAQTLADRILEHIEGERREETLTTLQELLERHSFELLPPQYVKLAPGERASQTKNFPGVGRWVTSTFTKLPSNWKGRYVERYEPFARPLFEAAQTNHDLEALASVTRRWPWTRSAETAAWVLGDLELEAGHLESALNAWARAERLAVAAGRVPAADKERREALARTWLEAHPRTSSDMSLAGAGGPIPRAETESWSADSIDFGLVIPDAYQFNAYPVEYAGTVLATNSIQVLALDAATGRPRWLSEGATGWTKLTGRASDLFDGVSSQHFTTAPAAGGRVVVAALQLPISRDPDARFHGIQITVPTPERRLFAYDLESGDELWNHAPPYVWNEDRDVFYWKPWEGDYHERMVVSAPPVVAGSRVLVPCHRQAGRFDFHLACYELDSGELLWQTPLISGQRPRNMFGRVSEEFVGTPVTVANEQVIVQTELGTIASVDLINGQIHWESQYETINLNSSANYAPARRRYQWRERAPVVVDDVIVSTPSDSWDLLILDLETGRVLSSQNEGLLGFPGVSLMIGADKDGVYLAGSGRIARLEKRGGFRSKFSSWSEAWHRDARVGRNYPRPLLTKDGVIVSDTSRKVFDRLLGLEKSEYEVPLSRESRGNLWVGEGVLFSLSKQRLSSFFDRRLLLERRRKARLANPDDPALILAEANLLLDWGQSEFESEARPSAALDTLRESEKLFLSLSEEAKEGARSRRYDLERARARIYEALGRRKQQKQSLEAALELASTRSARCDTLIDLEALALALGQTDERLARLNELAPLAGPLNLPRWRQKGNTSWFTGASILDANDWPEAFTEDFPMAAFVLLARADAYATNGDGLEALEELHQALADYGDLRLGESAAGTERTLAEGLRQRIDDRIRDEGPEIYAVFEARAAALLDEARDDAERLEAILDRFPSSKAAETARGRLVDLAFENADPVFAAEAVYGSTLRFDPRSIEGAYLLARLANVFGRRGNRELLAGLTASLAFDFPKVGADDESVETFPELALKSALPARPRLPEPTFDDRPRVAFYTDGTPYRLGRMFSSQVGVEPRVIVLQNGSLMAFDETDPAQPLWQRSVRSTLDARNAAIAEDRVLIATREYLEAYDAFGNPLWNVELKLSRLHRLCVSQGVAVLHARAPQGYNTLFAFDAREGTALWTLPLKGRKQWQRPMFAPGLLMMASQPLGNPDRLAIIDLFRGIERGRVPLPDDTPPFIEDSAWSHGRELFVPDVFSSGDDPSGVLVLDLHTKKFGWEVRFDRSEELVGSLGWMDEDYLVTEAEHGARNANGAVYRLDRRNRRLSKVFDLAPGARLFGVEHANRHELNQPYVFVLNRSQGDKTPVEAWDLEKGRRLWTYRIAASGSDLLRQQLPQPVVAGNVVALTYRSSEGVRNRTDVTLAFHDMQTGLPLDSRQLRREFRLSDSIELLGLGPTLHLYGNHGQARQGCLEILETSR